MTNPNPEDNQTWDEVCLQLVQETEQDNYQINECTKRKAKSKQVTLLWAFKQS